MTQTGLVSNKSDTLIEAKIVAATEGLKPQFLNMLTKLFEFFRDTQFEFYFLEQHRKYLVSCDCVK
jgi:hypothetical protein